MSFVKGPLTLLFEENGRKMFVNVIDMQHICPHLTMIFVYELLKTFLNCMICFDSLSNFF